MGKQCAKSCFLFKTWENEKGGGGLKCNGMAKGKKGISRGRAKLIKSCIVSHKRKKGELVPFYKTSQGLGAWVTKVEKEGQGGGGEGTKDDSREKGRNCPNQVTANLKQNAEKDLSRGKGPAEKKENPSGKTRAFRLKAGQFQGMARGEGGEKNFW